VCEHVNWTELTQVKEQWRSFVMTPMDFRVPLQNKISWADGQPHAAGEKSCITELASYSKPASNGNWIEWKSAFIGEHWHWCKTASNKRNTFEEQKVRNKELNKKKNNQLEYLLFISFWDEMCFLECVQS